MPKIPGNYALLFLAVTHTAGAIGLNYEPTAQIFRQLTPLNLIMTTLVVLYYHREWNLKFLIFLVITFLTGFFVELIGVETGFIFGSYHYGETLGPKLLDIPVIIGLNWVLLVYISGFVSRAFLHDLWLKVISGALLMVLLDILIEPTAIRFDYWQWENKLVPIRNYFGWFVVSLPLHYLFQHNVIQKTNRIAPQVYFIMLGFFFVLLLMKNFT